MDSLAMIQRLGGGQFLDKLYEAVVEISEEVAATGKPGAINVTLQITPGGKGELMVVIAESLTRRPPKEETPGTFFFAMDGALHREDPRQTKLDFRVVPDQTQVRPERTGDRIERKTEDA